MTAAPPAADNPAAIESLYRHAFFADPFGQAAKRAPALEARRSALAKRVAALSDAPPPADARSEGRAFYRSVARWMRDAARPFLASVNKAPTEKTVVFVASWLTGKIQRQALALREKGWRCYLVVQAHDGVTAEILNRGFRGAFDGVFAAPRTFFAIFALVRQLRPTAFHVHCATWSQALGRVVDEGKRRAACVCEVEDIFTVYAAPAVMAEVWPATAVALEWAMERYICTRVDGFVHQFAPAVAEELAERHGPLTPTAILPNYPFLRFTHIAAERSSRRDGVQRLVWAGNVWRADGSSAADLVPSAGLPAALESFLEQGFGCEIHVDPAKSFAPDARAWAPYRALERFPRFLFAQQGVPAEELSRRISHCDFGLLLMRLDLTRLRVRPEKLRLQVANKLFAYFEAGLPVLVNAEFAYMADLVTRHGVGLAVASDDIDRLAILLADFNHDQAVENIRRFNHDHAMEHRIGRLLALYRREAAAGHNQEDCVCCATPRM